MQTSSVIRACSSAALATAILFAPIGNIFSVQAPLIATPVAFADAPTPNNISGFVVTNASATSSSEAAVGMTVNVTLAQSGALQATTQTDANGHFSFTEPEGVSYVLTLVPAIGYGIPASAPTSITVRDLTGITTVSGFTVEKLPSIFLYGSSTVYVKLGTTYQDPGVELRALDGSVVHGYGIEATGAVDTNTAGVYTVTYHVDPKATNGFPVADATRQVIVGRVVVVPPPMIASQLAPTAQNTTSSCKLLNTYMRKGASNDKIEVLKLQTFLFLYEGLTSVRATGVYDEATERGVRIFQDRHFKEVLSLWGADENSGNVYFTTAKKINEVYCGHEFPLSFEQLKEIAAYRVAHQGSLTQHAAVSADKPVAVSNKNSGGIAGWWNRTKQALLAAFPSFGKKHDGSTTSASGTVAAASEKVDSAAAKAKAGSVATAFYNFRNFLNMTALAAIFALLLGVFAFGVSIYLYRRTRGDEREVEVVSATIHDIKEDTKKTK